MVRKQRVAVIGAGLSGLVAARELGRRGIDATVFDARDRVGGRLLQGRLATGVLVDAGGQFVGRSEPVVQRLAAELGVEVERLPALRAGGRAVRISDGRRHVESHPFSESPALAEEIRRLRAEVDTLIDRMDPAHPAALPGAAELDRLSIAEWAAERATPAGGREFLRAAGSLGDVGEISMLYFVWHLARFGGWEGAEQAWESHFVGGANQLPARLAAGLTERIRLGAIVTDLHQRDRVVVLEFADGASVEVDAVVIATGGADGGIRFVPPRPPEQQTLAMGWRGTHSVKLVVQYERAFWRDDGLSGSATGEGLLDVVSDVSSGGAALLCGLVFDAARIPAEWSEESLRGRLLDELAEFFGHEARHPLATFVHVWHGDPWTAGCGNALVPGVLTSIGDALTAPWGRVVWAGADRGDADYMEGAVQAAYRAADQVAALVADSPDTGSATG